MLSKKLVMLDTDSLDQAFKLAIAVENKLNFKGVTRSIFNLKHKYQEMSC